MCRFATRSTPGRRRVWAGVWLLALTCLGSPALRASPGGAFGLPFTRSYSFEEIGNVPRGARLGFDELGRVAVANAGSFWVLNDTAWFDRAEKQTGLPLMQRIVFGPDGSAYYGALGSWGRVELSPTRSLRPQSLVPANHPKWTSSGNFTDILITADGVYFGDFNGVVYWDRRTGEHTYFAVPEVRRLFAVGGTVFLSSRTAGIQALDVKTQSRRLVVESRDGAVWIDQVTTLDAHRVLVSTVTGELLVFDGTELKPWPGPQGPRPLARISALQRLTDGNVAIAINGRGLYLAAPDGKIIASYTTPEYHRITDLATRERGVLWISTETGVEKILYESPLTVFGQRLGLLVSWPQVVQWGDRIVVASGGRVYETSAPSPANPTPETKLFRLLPDQPAQEIWGLAARDHQLLVGTASGVLVRTGDGPFIPVLREMNAARLIPVGADLCYVIGPSEIAVLRRTGQTWQECAPRVPGLGYPSVAIGTKRAAWIELGANRVARVALDGDQLRVRVVENFPWPDPRWINIGTVGDTVVLSGATDARVFFDDRTETFTTAPALSAVLAQSPLRITRVREDDQGLIWATHDQGLLLIRRDGDGFKLDPASFGRLNDRFPLMNLLPGGEVWLATSQSLYHVERDFDHAARPPFKPQLVSVIDGRTNQELLPPPPAPARIRPLTYAENSLILRFFAGSYASQQAPAYTYRLTRGTSSWAPIGNGSLLTLTDLNEGAYRLQVYLGDAALSGPPALALDFEIAAPWYRTGWAYTLYTLGTIAVVFGLMRWSVHRTRLQNQILEQLVAARTNELRGAMQQLNEETRNAATVAERNRLAGEIHDSLQQGLSGLMLQLDATLKLPDLSGDVRSRLNVARNMVSFTRHEVQNAVWDMETPLLEGTELGEALKKIAALIGPGEAEVQIRITGEPQPLTPATKHHLLRIAQEAITNAVRHAAAKTIVIALAYDTASVTLSVTDDGNGFVAKEVLAKGLGHFGLRGLRGRAAKIGGELHLDSTPGRGTTVRVSVQTPAPVYVPAF